jgi:hypothetical protein
MATTFALNVSYSQVAVFDSAVAQPFSMWTEQHVHQGFAWRDGTVSFRTIASDGRHLVDVVVSSGDVELSPDAPRIIQTPFRVPMSGAVEIASIADTVPVELPSGLYALRFECFRIERRLEPRIRFVLIRTDRPTFEVLRADSELSLSGELLHTATKA